MKRIDVSDWVVDDQEPLGRDPKVWLTPNDADLQVGDSSTSWLFKSAKTGELHNGDTYRRYDDYVETIVHQLADLLGIPTARALLAVRNETEGVISRNVVRDEHGALTGDMTLLGAPGYVSCSGEDRVTPRPGHNLTNIAATLDGLKGPSNTPYVDWSAIDIFSGYLMLDALIANNDRHAENWAVEYSLVDPLVPDRLAASFDHGSALGASIEDSACHHKLLRIEKFCKRGLSKRFEDQRQTLVELWRESFDVSSDRAGYWSDRLRSLNEAQFEHLCHEHQFVSEPRANLMTNILKVNRRRILECSPHT